MTAKQTTEKTPSHFGQMLYGGLIGGSLVMSIALIAGVFVFESSDMTKETAYDIGVLAGALMVGALMLFVAKIKK